MEHLKKILARQAQGEFPHSGQFADVNNNLINNKELLNIDNQESLKNYNIQKQVKSNDNHQKFECVICQDRGLILDGDDIARPCKCMRQKAIINQFRSAQISQEMMECTFRSFRSRYYSKDYKDQAYNITSYDSATEAYNGAKYFVRDFLQGKKADGILFTGNVGCGKSFLACAIANALLEQGIEVLFIVVPDLLDEIKATYDSDNLSTNTEHSLLETARKVPLLILDDLGAHNYTDWVRNKLYSIINYRLNNQLPTVITTNLSLNELKEFLGERTTSRIIQMCQSYPIVVQEDIRVAKRKEKQK